MPTLNSRFEATDGQGRTTAAPAGLAQRGPLVPVTLMLSDAHRQILAQQAASVPDAVNGFGLIDTGASATCIDQAAATKAGLPIVDRTTMASASHAKHEAPVYVGKLVVPEFGDIDLDHAVGASLDGLNLIALIGRDVLQAGVLVYNGTAGSISLSV